MKCKSRQIRFFLTLTMALICSLGIGQETKRNVLFIAIDDLKPLLGCYGYDYMITPNIDKVAYEGVIFENAHCQQAVCGPARASILTGMRPDYTGVWDLRTRMRHVNPDILAMPQYFKNNGYSTVAIGKVYDPRCVDKKYDGVSWTIPYSESSKYKYPKEYGPPALSYYANKFAKDTVHKIEAEARAKGVSNIHAYVSERYKPSVECADVSDDAYMDGQICNNALKYMEELSETGKPFFLAVGFKRPHLPFAAPKKYWDLYKRDEVKLADYQKPVVDGVDMAYHNHGELSSYSDIPPVNSFSDIFTKLLPDEKQRELIHGYYASISFIDALVGKLLKRLEELNIEENTTIIIWGDHGWHLGDHALWCKHTNFEQATRVPLIIKGKDVDKGVHKHPVEFVDVFPTLCEMSGLKIPQILQGKSLVPVLSDVNYKVKDYAVSQFARGKNEGYSLRTDRYRFTLWIMDNYHTYSPFDENMVIDCELYDYETDPDETINLYRSEEHAHIVEQMMGYFREFVSQQNIELKDAGSNPANQKERPIWKLDIDGNFEKPLNKEWETNPLENKIVTFEILPDSPLGDNTLRVNVKEDKKNDIDINITSVRNTPIEKGKEVYLSFAANGNKLTVELISEKGAKISETLVPGDATFLHRLRFKAPEKGKYKLVFRFNEQGTYLLQGLRAEIN